jgi:peptide/nickel transport system substrate-binding protein
LKRLGTGLIIALVLIIILVGCTKSTSTTTSTSTTSTPPVTTTSSPTTAPAKTSGTTTTAAPSATTTSPTSSSTSAVKKGGTFKFIDPRNPSSTLGWWAESGNLATMASAPAQETLLYFDLAHNVYPMLATKWEIAPDLKSITFTLRKGVKFHDGSDFNADIAKWNFDMFLQAKANAVSAWDSVEKLDDYTIRINVKSWENTILDDISDTMYMVPKQTYDQKGKDWMRWNPVGTGPFKFVSFERDVSIKFTRFENYWQAGKPYLDAIELYWVQDPMTMSAAIRSEAVDAVGRDLARAEYDLVQAGYPLVSCYTGVVSLIPDSKNPDSPFANEKVRLALQYGIDREAIVKTLGFGFQQATYQYSHSLASSYIKDLPPRSYDLDKAKQLLAEAGYPKGFDTKFIAQNISTDKEQMVAVQGYLNKMGIRTSVDWVDPTTYDKYRVGGWQNGLLCNALVVSANGGMWAKTAFFQKGAYYPSLNKTDESAKLLTAVRSSKEYDPALMGNLNRYIYDTSMVIPLYATSRGHLYQSWVHDIGMYQGSGWTKWIPENIWLSK